MKKISIVTVCYNVANDIENTILSVINQTYSNIEYIIIDGASTDGTVDIIKKYSDKISFWISEPDLGIYDAMNKGLNKATGDWINFMNAGDSFYSINIIDRIFSASDYNDINVIFGRTLRRGKLMHLDPFFKKKHCLEMGFCHQSTFVRTKDAKKSMFNVDDYKLAADFNMLYSIYEKNGKFFNIGFPISVFDDTGISSTNKKKLLYETASITHQKHTVFYVKEYFLISIKVALYKLKKILSLI